MMQPTVRGKLERLLATEAREVNLAPDQQIRVAELVAGQRLPLLIEPAVADFDLVAWAQRSRDWIEGRLTEHGALLLRGCGVSSVERFEEFARVICPDLFGEYGDLPTAQGGEKVYQSTPYPPDKTILFHNESSHQHRWPLRQMFFCVQPSREGGETPIVDCRQLYRALPPEIIRGFAEKKLLYARSFTAGLDVSWRDFFRTDDRSQVEDYCRRAGMEWEWTAQGLRTRQTAIAVASHPRSGEPVFFNQLQLHHSFCLDPELLESLAALFAEEDFPRNVYYGDGSPIADSVMAEVSDAYWRHAVSFPWQAGDVLLLDNMLTAHARNPYVGPRRIVVAMGEMVELATLSTATARREPGATRSSTR
jgi:alpha-ketoglutarate-dependent taurine dioxygenase